MWKRTERLYGGDYGETDYQINLLRVIHKMLVNEIRNDTCKKGSYRVDSVHSRQNSGWQSSLTQTKAFFRENLNQATTRCIMVYYGPLRLLWSPRSGAGLFESLLILTQAEKLTKVLFYRVSPLLTFCIILTQNGRTNNTDNLTDQLKN